MLSVGWGLVRADKTNSISECGSQHSRSFLSPPGEFVSSLNTINKTKNATGRSTPVLCRDLEALVIRPEGAGTTHGLDARRLEVYVARAAAAAAPLRQSFQGRYISSWSVSPDRLPNPSKPNTG